MEIIDQSKIQNLKSEIVYDVVIVGGGVAGLSAALWCDELGLSALVLEETAEPGGQLLWVHNEIKNYPGREAKNGRELRDDFWEQLATRAFEMLLEAPIAEIDLEKKTILLAGGTRLRSRALVLATGVRRRKLDVAGEAEFAGRGIIESGKKDAARAAGKNVLIVGGGDAAFENALILSETAARVTLAHRRREFSARAEFTEKVKAHPKITILTETVVSRVTGGARVESVELIDLPTRETQILAVDAMLVRIGVEPNTRQFRGRLKMDEHGYLEVDRNGETSIKGVFAAGDVANPLAPTVSSAAGMGATAAKAIYSLLNH